TRSSIMVPFAVPSDGLLNADAVRMVFVSLAALMIITLELIQPSTIYTVSDDTNPLSTWIPPALAGLLIGVLKTVAIIVGSEYSTMNGEWLLTIFSRSYDFNAWSLQNVRNNDCPGQILNVIAMVAGAKLSLITSAVEILPIIDPLLYLMVILGSFCGTLGICLTSTTFTDHFFLAC
ncbi:unnamed protein product, partial [Didymodactylos carnosus]